MAAARRSAIYQSAHEFAYVRQVEAGMFQINADAVGPGLGRFPAGLVTVAIAAGPPGDALVETARFVTGIDAGRTDIN